MEQLLLLLLFTLQTVSDITLPLVLLSRSYVKQSIIVHLAVHDKLILPTSVYFIQNCVNFMASYALPISYLSSNTSLQITRWLSGLTQVTWVRVSAGAFTKLDLKSLPLHCGILWTSCYPRKVRSLKSHSMNHLRSSPN